MSIHLNIYEPIVDQAAVIESEVEFVECEYFASLDNDVAYSWQDIVDIQNETDGYDLLFGLYANFYQTIVQMAELFAIIKHKDGSNNEVKDYAVELAGLFKQWQNFWYPSELDLREHIDLIEQQISNLIVIK